MYMLEAIENANYFFFYRSRWNVHLIEWSSLCTFSIQLNWRVLSVRPEKKKYVTQTGFCISDKNKYRIEVTKSKFSMFPLPPIRYELHRNNENKKYVSFWKWQLCWRTEYAGVKMIIWYFSCKTFWHLHIFVLCTKHVTQTQHIRT